MWEGKTFFGATGIPMRKIALVSTRLEDWLPEPLTVAAWMVRSFTTRGLVDMGWRFSPTGTGGARAGARDRRCGAAATGRLRNSAPPEPGNGPHGGLLRGSLPASR